MPGKKKYDFSKEPKFHLVGKCSIKMSNTATATCGGKTGFHMTFKMPGETSYSGSVMPKRTARRLANHIIKILDSNL